ncbi:MAG TPA: hypothetical protein VJS64_09635 [Pyrinomonadaceae bacterium]|nr:hypothetical protein [Pyrinomonadaceae bacterium]
MFRRIAFALVLLLIFAAHASAKSWQGITPLRSSRSDVARILNQQISSEDATFRYEYNTEDVVFFFSGLNEYADDCVKALPAGTVLRIDITPKREVRLSDLQNAKSKLTKLESSSEFILEGEAYLDENEGFVATTKNGLITKLVFIAAKNDQHLCAKYYEEPRVFAVRLLCILCPTTAVDCPTEVGIGAQITFTSRTAAGYPPPRLTFNWTVTDGIIVEGQGTDTIKVDTRGVKAKSITATIEVSGIDPSCGRTASCSTQLIHRN